MAFIDNQQLYMSVVCSSTSGSARNTFEEGKNDSTPELVQQ